jgi:hypothetical protein
MDTGVSYDLSPRSSDPRHPAASDATLNAALEHRHIDLKPKW